MKQAIKWYVLSNVHIALCAMFFLIGGFSFFQIDINYALISSLGIGTWIIYILHRYIGGQRLSDDIPEERFNVAQWPKKTFFGIIIIATLIVAGSAYYIPTSLYVPLIVLGLVSASYIAPLFGGGRRLRDIGKLKIYLIAIVWAGVFILPYWLSNHELQLSQILVLWLEKAIFIFALTLPFEIRDRDLDEASKVSTMATGYSDKTIINVVFLLIAVCMALVAYQWWDGVYSLDITLILLSLLGLQSLLSKMTQRPQNEIFFLGILDSFILAQGLAHWYAA